MPDADATNNQPPRLILCSGRDFQKIRILPQALRLDEIDAVLGEVAFALSRVKLECHMGIETIPFLAHPQERIRGF